MVLTEVLCSQSNDSQWIDLLYFDDSVSDVGLDGGQLAGSLKLDVLFPVNGYKRFSIAAFEFVYPQSWLEDVTLYRRRVERAEFQRGVEFKQVEDMERVARGQSIVQPAVGFGPPASSGEENISVVAAPSPGLVCVPQLYARVTSH